MLHPGRPLDLSDWTVHPSTVIGIAALGGLYWLADRRADRQHSQGDAGGAAFAVQRAGFRVPGTTPGAEGGFADQSHAPHTESRGATPTQKLLFLSGLIVLFMSLNGPIHDLSDYYLFSAHMVQHLLLSMVVIPLLLAGTPGWMLRPLLRNRMVAAFARRLTTPAACFAVFNVTLVGWHLPPLYNLAMAYHGVHIVQHLCFLAASTLMWWPLMSPLPELPRASYPKQMLYVFLLTLPMSVVGMYLTYAREVLYPAYVSAPRIWGLSPLEDQLIGGLIMWIPGGLILLGALTTVFFKWAALEADDAAPTPVEWTPSVR